MGGTTFHDESDTEDVAAAFSELVDAARYEYGHGGYTGTIAEKDGYVVFDVPAGHTADEAIRVLQGARYDYSTDSVDLPDWMPSRIYEVYDDKWGPAVAIRAEGGGWHFLGWASC